MQAEQQATAVDCLASEEIARLGEAEAIVVVQLGKKRRTIHMKFPHALRYADRMNARMRNAGTSIRYRVEIEP